MERKKRARTRHTIEQTEDVTRRGSDAASDERRIGKQITVRPDGCWVWRNADKYGRTEANGEKVSVHRFVYETLVGPIPDGHHLHHECEVPGCCNPSHLIPLTPVEHKMEHKLRRVLAPGH